MISESTALVIKGHRVATYVRTVRRSNRCLFITGRCDHRCCMTLTQIPGEFVIIKTCRILFLSEGRLWRQRYNEEVDIKWSADLLKGIFLWLF